MMFIHKRVATKWVFITGLRGRYAIRERVVTYWCGIPVWHKTIHFPSVIPDDVLHILRSRTFSNQRLIMEHRG